MFSSSGKIAPLPVGDNKVALERLSRHELVRQVWLVSQACECRVAWVSGSWFMSPITTAAAPRMRADAAAARPTALRRRRRPAIGRRPWRMGGWIGAQADYVMVPYADFDPLKFPDKAQGLEKFRDLTCLSDILPTGFHRAVPARAPVPSRWSRQ